MAPILCQPYFDDQQIRFYSTLGAIASAPFFSLDLASDIAAAWPGRTGGPNSVAVRNGKIFVSIDCNGQGGVLIYDFAEIFPIRTSDPIVVKPGPVNGLSSTGIAVEPVSGDLYIPTIVFGMEDAGVFVASAASNYTAISQFSSFNSDNSVAENCANLAFDGKGNLWMTTFSPSASPDEHFLICYKGLDKSAYYKVVNSATKIYVATSQAGVAINVHLLSGPEGIAFDAAGNLWLGNNNDDFPTNNAGEGTLVRISAAYLNTLLAGTPALDNVVPAADADVMSIPAGKLGGLEFDGSVIYINDQGQSQGSDFTLNGTVWRWDITKPFSTDFGESGIHTTYPGNGAGAILYPWFV
ncbi:MAG: repeat containing protein [Planctomycetaceae bacterium]|nr:repeat containing protein [Planctomycetaceae bacterium]